jgi:hypothetical protein
MKIAIDKELEKKSQEDKKKFDIDPTNEVKLLLAGDATEDARILRGLSNNSQFNRIEKIRGEQLELEKLENGYDGKVYKRDQIKKLAVDYHLRFLPSRYFTGSFDVEVTSKIKEFAKVTNTSIDDFTLNHQFYVLAPQEMFQLKDEKYITKKQLDPAIFYKIDDQHYKLIHKWGSDFTVFRLLEGFRFKSWWIHQLFNTIMVLPIFTLLSGLFFSVSTIDNYPIRIFLLSTFLSFVFSYFRWGWGKHDEGGQIDAFFAPNNWDSDSKVTR